jgi:hypothetical protein
MQNREAHTVDLQRTSICHGFKEQFDFPYDTQTKLDEIIKNQKKLVMRKI